MSACYRHLQTHDSFGPIYANIRTTMESLLDGHTFELNSDDVNAEVRFYLQVFLRNSKTCI